jgi:E3 ubiquitin-protein ligase HUWE1
LQVTDFELIPGGRDIRVTEENKHEYVDKVAEHRLTTAIRPQINAFMDGFNELVSRELISIFNDKELELLISGLPEIDCEWLFALAQKSYMTVMDLDMEVNSVQQIKYQIQQEYFLLDALINFNI